MVLLSVLVIYLPFKVHSLVPAIIYLAENVGIPTEMDLESINYMKNFKIPTFNTILFFNPKTLP